MARKALEESACLRLGWSQRKGPVMRMLRLACAVGAALGCACGGGTPPPKESDEAVASSASKSSQGAPAEEEATPSGGASAAPAASPSPAQGGASSAAPSTDSSSSSGDDPWMASHQMTPKDVLRGVRPAQGKAQACFRAGAKRDPSTSGEVKIRFVVTNAGSVRAWRDDDSSMSDAEVTQCVGELIKTLKFPKQKSPGDAYGIYTVNFSN